MTKNKIAVYAALICAVFFTLLFHRQDLGLNILLIETVFLTWLFISKSIDFRIKNNLIFGAGVLLTASAVILVYSPYVITINIISVFLFVGVLIYPQAKSALNSLLLAFCNIPASQSSFFLSLSHKDDGKPKKRKIVIFFIPVIIIIFFLIIYSNSSPYFSNLLENVGTFLNDNLFFVFKNVDALAIFTYLVGLAISNFIFFRKPTPEIIADDKKASDELIRFKTKKIVPSKFKLSALKDEYKASIFLLLIINILLFVVNLLDVYWVWFNFSWNGLYLKQFVHEGTYLLLLSIVCSIIIVLYFFRGNLNFYSKNKFLRQLSLIWLMQNAVLTVSVAIRNMHYINYFALAYKRIGLMLFLLLTLYGLYTVYVKVSKKKSSFYLFRTNILAIYVVLVLSSLVNWENIIAKYNFSHYKTSFAELDYLSRFPNKSVPYLIKSTEELTEINTVQKGLFPFEKDYMKPEAYEKVMNARKQMFIREWESRSVLSWNWPEYKAYKELKDN